MHNGQFLSRETASAFHYWKQRSTSLPKILTRTLDNNNCGGKTKPQKEHTLSQSLNLTCSMQQSRLLGELNYTFNGDVFGASHSLRYWNLLGTSTSDIGVLAVSMFFFDDIMDILFCSGWVSQNIEYSTYTTCDVKWMQILIEIS